MKKLIVLILLCSMIFTVSAEEARYNHADKLYKQGKYSDAAEIFEELGDYEKSETKYTQSKYREAIELLKNESFEEALEIFKTMPKYKDSKKYINKANMRILRRDYAKADSLFKEGKFEEALVIFEHLSSYHDSKDRAKATRKEIVREEREEQELGFYNKGIELKNSDKPIEAREYFIKSGPCKDATEQIYAINREQEKNKIYNKANEHFEQHEYFSAYKLYSLLEEYKDSRARMIEAEKAYKDYLYNIAENEKDSAAQYIIFAYLNGFYDTKEKLSTLKPDEESIYNQAQKYLEQGEYDFAIAGLEHIQDYKDSKNMLVTAKENLLNTQKLNKAKFLSELWQIDEANEMFAELGEFGDANIFMSGNRFFTAKELRDYARSDLSPIYTAKDGSRHQYRIYKGVQLWQEARRFCEALSGHLATISDEEENSFIHDFMIECGYTEAYFGLSDEHRERNWVWVTGEELKFSNWAEGEPSRCPRERYGMFFTTILKPRTWNDSHFYEHAKSDPGCSFIIEWDLSD